MEKSIITLALCATFATPATASYVVKVNPPKCEIVIVEKVWRSPPITSENRQYFPGNERPSGDASAVSYTNGLHQNGGYRKVPAMERSRLGDRVNLCLIEFLAGCPAGDDRGKTYRATNLRTRLTWTAADASHICGGA